jgi:hypothetical protein
MQPQRLERPHNNFDFLDTKACTHHDISKEHMHALIGKVGWPSVSPLKKPETTEWISYSDYESSDDDTDQTFGAAFVDM